MGLFDSIKDALTTDDAERYGKAEKRLAEAEAELAEVRATYGTKDDPMSKGRIDKAEHAVAEARSEAEELAAKAAQEKAEADAKAKAEADAKAKADAEAAAAAQAKADADAAAAQAAEAEQLAATTLREYTVVKGDTLSAIGKRFGVKWRDIAELNDIKNPDLIFPGQVFKIPNA